MNLFAIIAYWLHLPQPGAAKQCSEELVQEYNIVWETLESLVPANGQDCYDFAFKNNVSHDNSAEWNTISLRNGASNSTDETITTIFDVLDFYKYECLDPCSDTTVGTSVQDTCILEFNDEGIPERVVVNRHAWTVGEEIGYLVKNFTLLEQCSNDDNANNTGSIEGSFPLVPSYLEQFETFYAVLENKTCYDFTYSGSYMGSVMDIPITVSVQSGLSNAAEGRLSSLFDLVDTFRKVCLCNYVGNATEEGDLCPSHASNCVIEFDQNNDVYGFEIPKYVKTEYPDTDTTDIEIDIQNFSFQTCPCDSEFLAAKAAWTNPPCYDFTIRRVGDYPEAFVQAFNIQVRNRRIVNLEPYFVPWTIPQLFNEIQNKCINGCHESNSLAFDCINVYDDELGFPRSIYINFDRTAINDEEIYVITNFQTRGCDGRSLLRGREDKNDK